MASVLGVNANKAADPSPSNILDPGLLGGKVRVMQDTYEAAALANGSDISIGKALPVGAIIVGVKISTDALGGGVTVEVGDAGDSARYVDPVDCTGATETDAVLVDGLGYVITGTDDTQLLITTGVGAATGTISIVVFYVVE